MIYLGPQKQLASFWLEREFKTNKPDGLFFPRGPNKASEAKFRKTYATSGTKTSRKSTREVTVAILITLKIRNTGFGLTFFC